MAVRVVHVHVHVHVVAVELAVTKMKTQMKVIVMDDVEMERQRVWYYNDNNNASNNNEDRLGLDPSILHLRQIWSQFLYSNFFNDNDNDDSDDADVADADDCQMMFQGLQFCMFVNGWDLLNSNTNTSMNSSPQHDDDLEYKEATELPSLHIYHDNNNDNNISHQLYQRHGGGKVVPNKSKAQNLILKQPFKQLEKENANENANTRRQPAEM